MTAYAILKIVHIFAWASWMAGLFYLPRIFVYHAERANGPGHTSETFKIMEGKLHRLIMGPAMIAAWITGLALGALYHDAGALWGWLGIKLALVAAMTGIHLHLGRVIDVFARDANTRSGRHYRWLNEAPTLLFLIVVALAVLKPRF